MQPKIPPREQGTISIIKIWNERMENKINQKTRICTVGDKNL